MKKYSINCYYSTEKNIFLTLDSLNDPYINNKNLLTKLEKKL